VHELRGLGEALVPDAAQEAVRLGEPLNVLCHVVAGKRVEAEAFGGRLLSLSTRGGTLLTPRRLRSLSNLKLELRPVGRGPVELYAKVVRVAGDDGSIEVRFSAPPADVDHWLQALVDEARAKAGSSPGGA
jgi:hypothetical protein